MSQFSVNTEREDEPKDNWFIKTITKASIISGLAFGGYKFMKGPHGKLVREYLNKDMYREMLKSVEIETGEKLDINIEDLSKNPNAKEGINLKFSLKL
jgi:hypothetical protein